MSSGIWFSLSDFHLFEREINPPAAILFQWNNRCDTTERLFSQVQSCRLYHECSRQTSPRCTTGRDGPYSQASFPDSACLLCGSVLAHLLSDMHSENETVWCHKQEKEASELIIYWPQRLLFGCWLEWCKKCPIWNCLLLTS